MNIQCKHFFFLQKHTLVNHLQSQPQGKVGYTLADILQCETQIHWTHAMLGRAGTSNDTAVVGPYALNGRFLDKTMHQDTS